VSTIVLVITHYSSDSGVMQALYYALTRLGYRLMATVRASNFGSSGCRFDFCPGRNQVTLVNSVFHPSEVG